MNALARREHRRTAGAGPALSRPHWRYRCMLAAVPGAGLVDDELVGGELLAQGTGEAGAVEAMAQAVAVARLCTTLAAGRARRMETRAAPRSTGGGCGGHFRYSNQMNSGRGYPPLLPALSFLRRG